MKDIDEIRRVNLRLLEAECGNATAAAKLLDMSLAQFANLRDGAKDSQTGKRRGMRKDTARRIEKAAGKPHGWLDVDHEGYSASDAGKPSHVPTGWEKLDAIGRAQVEAFIKGLLSRPPEAQDSGNNDRPSGD
ncbi:hypothetical protein [Burkholderia pseudomallei]|uniref:hypothetical protein n=1 Tax=Burkholderia pseudomallei TaxID=28450 RepID=UPI000F04AAA4|nr:hypothetical protein [Burkholderia pseudomallei]MBD2953670.1 hypothetical protein [Burkholderia pseudomallei]MBD2972065.1 hypothetical protein [Burkholderia pseudomallei]MCW0024675.1 hypothetical protein [Burkholderia pseudomallei]MCW0156022.1 hypothetical protein [Burkholderia pseudomallei]MCW0169550.1 hypothetical protein [Burkholderia pseudomallei]